MVELIKKKRDGQELTKDEIKFIIDGFVSGKIPDYQMASWLMAVYFKGMSDTETAALTEAMMYSGEVIDLSSIPGIKVDKHSTGGVGDKTTLVLGPLVAAAEVYVAKMSGRGLGHTGGTLDKLAAIPGFESEMSSNDFINRVKKHHLAVCSQNENLVPADKKIYALRDVTGTVDNISLIASSIMSKKLACGADAIVIDLKVGDGAFIKTVEDGERLADIMIKTAAKMGKKLTAVLTSMEEPLGYAIGNILEVKEAIDTLRGHGPEDLTELCLSLGSHMLLMAGRVKDFEEGRTLLKSLIDNGKAFDKLVEMVVSQGGDPSFIEDSEKFDVTKYAKGYAAVQDGYITHLGAMDIGLASMNLGAGRETKDSIIDYSAGIILRKKVGDKVEKGEILAIMFANEEAKFDKAKRYLDDAFTFSDVKPIKSPLILEVKN